MEGREGTPGNFCFIKFSIDWDARIDNTITLA